MRHPAFEAQLEAQLDGELAPDEGRALEEHLAQCAECTSFRDQRLALRAAIKARLPAFPASPELRRRVQASIAEQARGQAPKPKRLDWWLPLALAASMAVVALGSWNLALRHSAGEVLADEVLASHIRALMPGHLTDVPSSDQHTVKPWFNGRLDFSPPVHDFAGDGFPLIGGRLDYLHGGSVAALAYGRRQHLISVFLWPASRGTIDAPARRERQGYHELHWTTPDYSYFVVSDLGAAELGDFARMLQRADSAEQTVPAVSPTRTLHP